MQWEGPSGESVVARRTRLAPLLASVRFSANDFYYLIGDVVKGQVLMRNFISNQAAVNPSLWRALKSNMRGKSTYESDEVVIVAWGDGISTKVTDGLRVNLGGSIETKTDIDVLIFQVTIDSFWKSNNTTLRDFFGEVLSKLARVRVLVITPDDCKIVEIEGIGSLKWGLELF